MIAGSTNQWDNSPDPLSYLSNEPVAIYPKRN